jgi:RimJ/RimL family protein N-acetyltransferase
VHSSFNASIAPLTPADAGEVSAMLTAACPAYAAHFHPFPFDENSIRTQLESARRDQFFSLRMNGELAGLFMLRGLDAGFARPAFGVFIAEKFSRRGLARLALAESESWCRAHNLPELMLTVDHGNTTAAEFYARAGFTIESRDASRTLMSRRLAP